VSNVQPPPAVMIEALERILRAQLADHRRLLDCLDRKREAIRTAQIGRVSDIVEEERRVAVRIAEADRHRGELVRRIAQALMPAAQQPPALAELAHLVEEPIRTRLLASAAELRDAAEEVRSRSSIIRAAAEALSRHMSGVMQSVQSALSRAGVYGRRGEMALGAQLEFSVDVKS
jgi:hypothetical protein